MANLKFGNTNIGKISIIEPYEEVFDENVSSEVKEWVRPSEWLDMPVIGSGDDKVAILMYVPSGYDVEVTIPIRGTYIGENNYPTDTTVDWGDGSTSNINGIVYHTTLPNNYDYPRHTLSFDNLPVDSEFTYNGAKCRQALIQLVNNSGCSFLDLTYLKSSAFDGYDNNVYHYGTSNVLDLHVASQNLSNLYLQGENRGSLAEVQRVVIDVPQPLSSFAYMFNDLHNLQKVQFPEYICSGLSSIPYAFRDCYLLKEVPYFDTSSATNVVGLFYECNSLEKIPDLDLSNCTSMNSYAVNCKSLKELPHFNVNNCNLTMAFYGCYSIKSIPSGITFQNSNLQQAFQSNYSLKSVPNNFFEHIGSGATNTLSMFVACRNLTSIPKINLPNVTSCASMFNGCYSLESAHIQDLSSCTSFNSMFRDCESLRNVKIDSQPSNLTDTATMFYGCRSLKYAPYIDTSNVTNMSSMYGYCQNLIYSPVYDFSSAQNISSMYIFCDKVKEINVKNLNGSNITNISQFISRCYSLNKWPSGIFEDQFTTPATGVYAVYSCPIDHVPYIYASGESAYRMFRVEGYSIESVGEIYFGAETNCGEMFYGQSRLRNIGSSDCDLVTNFSSAFVGCRSLERSDLYNVNISIAYYDCFLGSGALTNIIENLSSGVVGQTLDIRNNYGAATLHPDTISIATSKGWTVVTT